MDDMTPKFPSLSYSKMWAINPPESIDEDVLAEVRQAFNRRITDSLFNATYSNLYVTNASSEPQPPLTHEALMKAVEAMKAIKPRQTCAFIHLDNLDMNVGFAGTLMELMEWWEVNQDGLVGEAVRFYLIDEEKNISYAYIQWR